VLSKLPSNNVFQPTRAARGALQDRLHFDATSGLLRLYSARAANAQAVGRQSSTPVLNERLFFLTLSLSCSPFASPAPIRYNALQ